MDKPIEKTGVYKVLVFFLVAVAASISLSIALRTRYNAHPDEYTQMLAFGYYEEHWWLPDLNSDELSYEPWGTNRVFTGEVVYLLFAKITKALSPVFNLGGELFNTNFGVVRYRVINVASFIVLLAGLFLVKSRSFQFNKIAFTLLIIPQVYYIFSYANSDAWGIVVSVLLFLYTVVLLEKPVRSWTFWQKLLMGFLTGLILLAKSNFFAALILPYSLLAIASFQEVRQKTSTVPILLRQFTLVGFVAFLVILPLKIIYPLTQPNYAARMIEMKNQRAIDGLKPSDPTEPTLMLASKGKSVLDVLKLQSGRSSWLYVTYESFYGVFGYMNVRGPLWIPIAVSILFLTSIVITYVYELRFWNNNESVLKYALIISPFIVLFNLAASLYNSWTVDYQPQGRYIFPSLIAISLMLSGVSPDRTQKHVLEKLRTPIFLILYGCCLYAIYSMMANPYLYIKPKFQ